MNRRTPPVAFVSVPFTKIFALAGTSTTSRAASAGTLSTCVESVAAGVPMISPPVIEGVSLSTRYDSIGMPDE